MLKFIRFLAVLWVSCFTVTSVFAATCDREYDSCSTGYFISGTVCNPCSDAGTGCTCAGGTAAPVCTVTISYNLNGGSGTAPSATTCTNGSVCTLTNMNATTFYRAGYKLIGWSTSNTATTASYATSWTFTSDTTLYAVWSKCSAGTYHPNSSAGTAANVCTNAGDGYFVASEGANSQDACAVGSYSEKSSASTKCTACPGGRTTSGTGTKYNATANTACSTTCPAITNLATWATPSWSNNSVSNLCTVATCNACAKGTGAATCSVSTSGNKCTYSGTCSAGYNSPSVSGTTISCTANTITINYNANATGASGSTSDTSCSYDGTCTA
ncbi:MAG: InlB B-repeat-containing protein, partial [Proteobacteria bacterium]|nr:InlB B-repeat-containing protein [Candidatus Enterousia scatequi]